jgi:hypothetical protein
MRKLIYSLICLVMLGTTACRKDDNLRFDDFEYTTVYFPYQYPVRTLVLGDYGVDNENDNDLKFLISARVGGLYENKTNWQVDYTIDPVLGEKLATSNNDVLEVLPAKYYTVGPQSRFTIPSGEFYGSLEVQLTDEFLNDPLAFKTHYVLPVVITGSTADSILSGRSTIANPDPRVAGNWSVTPKHFTLFGIKFMNPYHGKYLHRGRSVIKDGTGTPIDTLVYRQRYVEQDEIWSLQTTGRNRVTVTGVLRADAGSPGNFKMDLDFDAKGDAVIKETAGSTFPITGSAKFIKEGDMWGNIKRNAIHLSYEVTQGANTHYITDTLVVRDRDVRFEEFVPKILN